jgi:hypothetical protein
LIDKDDLIIVLMFFCLSRGTATMASYDGYDPATQVSDLTDKVILVTGGEHAS